MMTRSMYDKVILFTVFEYLSKQIDSDTETYRETEMMEVRDKLNTYRRTHLFSPAEAKLLAEVESLKRIDLLIKAFKKVKDMPVDYSIYSLELLALWVQTTAKKDRAQIFYSDTKILKLKSTLVIDMLKMGARDADRVDEIRGIIMDSRLVAKMFINLVDNEVE